MGCGVVTLLIHGGAGLSAAVITIFLRHLVRTIASSSGASYNCGIASKVMLTVMVPFLVHSRIGAVESVRLMWARICAA